MGRDISRRTFLEDAGKVGLGAAFAGHLPTIVPRHVLGGKGFTAPSELLNIAAPRLMDAVLPRCVVAMDVTSSLPNCILALIPNRFCAPWMSVLFNGKLTLPISSFCRMSSLKPVYSTFMLFWKSNELLLSKLAVTASFSLTLPTTLMLICWSNSNPPLRCWRMGMLGLFSR